MGSVDCNDRSLTSAPLESCGFYTAIITVLTSQPLRGSSSDTFMPTPPSKVLNLPIFPIFKPTTRLDVPCLAILYASSWWPLYISWKSDRRRPHRPRGPHIVGTPSAATQPIAAPLPAVVPVQAKQPEQKHTHRSRPSPDMSCKQSFPSAPFAGTHTLSEELLI